MVVRLGEECDSNQYFQNIVIQHLTTRLFCPAIKPLIFKTPNLLFVSKLFTDNNQQINLDFFRNQSSGIIYENVSTPSRNPVYVNYRPSRFQTPVKPRHCSNNELSTAPPVSPDYLSPMTVAKVIPVERKGQDTVLYNTPVKRNYQSRVSSVNCTAKCISSGQCFRK